MADVGDVQEVLLELCRHEGRRDQLGGMRPLGSGRLHVEYRDDRDHDFLVTVHRVPRVRLPLPQVPTVVGEVDGVQVQLAEVIVGNFIEVVLTTADGAAKQAISDDFAATYRVWEERMTAGDREDPPPPWPGERLSVLMPTLRDPAGTAYRCDLGQCGGQDDPWDARFRFRPPPGAQRLWLTFPDPAGQGGGKGGVEVEIALGR